MAIETSVDLIAGTVTFRVDRQSVVADLIAIAGGEVAWQSLVELGQQALAHGVKQKCSDPAALGRDPDTGKSASPAAKFSRMVAVVERLNAGGPWNARGGSSLPRLDRAALFVALGLASEDYAKATGKKVRTAEEWESMLRSQPDEVLRVRLTVPLVAGHYAVLTARGTDAGADLCAEAESE